MEKDTLVGLKADGRQRMSVASCHDAVHSNTSLISHTPSLYPLTVLQIQYVYTQITPKQLLSGVLSPSLPAQILKGKPLYLCDRNHPC